MEPLRICHVITRMNLGGAEENTLLTCQGLAAKGHHVTLVTGLTEGPEGNLLEHADLTGIEVVNVPCLIRNLSLRKDWEAYRTLRRLFAERPFDVVHTHASKAGILGRLAAHRAGVPMVTHTIHGQAFHPFQSALRNRLYITAETIAARRSHRIFAVAQAMIDQCVDAHIAPRDKYRVVYSGMNLQAFMNARPDPELRASLGLPAGVPVVGVVARMFAQKGYEDVLAAAPILAREFPDLHFLLVGDGELRPALEAEIQRLGLTGRFVFTGLVPPQDVCRYLPFMSVLMHLSYHEGLPRTAVQALAARVPVVAYPVDGTPEVVIDGVTGCLAPVRDAAGAAERAAAILRDPALRERMGAAGQDAVSRRFDTQLMVDTLDAEYRQFFTTHKTRIIK